MRGSAVGCLLLISLAADVAGYALELRHRGRLPGESQVLETRLELYETKGWCVDVRTTATHDGASPIFTRVTW
jgi:hypothetical protein